MPSLARQLAEALVVERMTAKDSGYKLDARKTSLADARAYAERKMASVGLNLDVAAPDFDENYLLLQQRLSKARSVARVEMPVINGEDVPDFQRALAMGKLDIFKPWAKGKFHAPGYSLKVGEGEEWLSLGFQDGDMHDDRLAAKLTGMPAVQLLPTQNQVWFDKLVEAMIEGGTISSSHPWARFTMVVSREGYILDGHHRWGLAMLTNPSFQLKVIYVPLPLDDLLQVGRTYGAAIGNPPNV